PHESPRGPIYGRRLFRRGGGCCGSGDGGAYHVVVWIRPDGSRLWLRDRGSTTGLLACEGRGTSLYKCISARRRCCRNAACFVCATVIGAGPPRQLYVTPALLPYRQLDGGRVELLRHSAAISRNSSRFASSMVT